MALDGKSGRPVVHGPARPAPTPREVGDAATRLVRYARLCGLIDAGDERWAYNRVLECVGAWGPGPSVTCGDWSQGGEGQDAASPAAGYDFERDLALLAEAGVLAGQAEDSATGRERLSMRVMGSIMARPSEIAHRFEELFRREGPVAATDWFYTLCCDAGYVRRSAIARNLRWTTPTRWGNIEITINKSKPEKDPRDIAHAMEEAVGERYPACALCRENEGYSGRPASVGGGHAARQNLRIVPIRLGGEGWGLQYSPYAYYREHCIVMSDEHRPMHIDGRTLGCLLVFVGLFPQYFIGSNADLPIVGGSILTHDHFQGGRHEFAMMRARTALTLDFPEFPQVDACILKWPLSVVKLVSKSRDALLAAAMRVLDVWEGFDDATAGIVSHGPDGSRHNTVTPICRKVGDAFELYLALRCNVTTDEHPLGVFHPHEDKWHIKKENIGLIEVMGLAILPPRLEPELDRALAYLLEDALGELERDSLTAAHAPWAREVALRHPGLVGAGRGLAPGEKDRLRERARDVLYQEVGLVFSGVLEDAGVFKDDETGRAALGRFVSLL